MLTRARLFLFPIFLFTIALFISRIYFYFQYQNFFEVDFQSLALSFARGLRFDISTAFIM